MHGRWECWAKECNRTFVKQITYFLRYLLLGEVTLRTFAGSVALQTCHFYYYLHWTKQGSLGALARPPLRQPAPEGFLLYGSLVSQKIVVKPLKSARSACYIQWWSLLFLLLSAAGYLHMGSGEWRMRGATKVHRRLAGHLPNGSPAQRTIFHKLYVPWTTTANVSSWCWNLSLNSPKQYYYFCY